jgi:transcriptional regulator with XRE-family HTH domain
VALKQQPTVEDLRMRIAETRILKHRVAARLDISGGHLSNILNGRVPSDAATVARIAAAIEAVAAEAA